MTRGHRYVTSLLLGFNGCAARASYRVYDPSYSDYHAWDGNEIVFYQRWEVETHCDHRESRKRHNHHDNRH